MREGTKFVMATLLSVGLGAVVAAAPAGAGEQLTKKELRQEANDICSTATQEVGDAFDGAFTGLTEGQEPSAEQIQAAVDGALPIFRAMLDAVEALDGPSAYEKKVDKVVNQYRAVADDIEEDPAIAFSEGIYAKPNTQARKLGLKDCRQGG